LAREQQVSQLRAQGLLQRVRPVRLVLEPRAKRRLGPKLWL